MDPQATLEAYWSAVLSHEWDAACEAFDALRSWLERGGFEPEWKHPHGRSEFFAAHHRRADRDTITRLL